MEAGTSVWERRSATGAEVTPFVYNGIIGAVLAWGFFLNAALVEAVPAETMLGLNRWLFLIGYVVLVMAGTVILTKSDNPVVSFLGYNLIAVPVGLLLVRYLAFVDADVVSRAMLTTGGVTLAMMLLSMLFPAALLRMGRALLIGLVVAVVAELLVALFASRHPVFFDWVFVLLFSGYIGFDWARAQALPRTVDNAVDAAAALYLDIINLFLRLVSILQNQRR
jgi:FtsH-binding integral membrane protein